MNRFLKKDFRVMLMGLLLLASCQAYSNSEDQTIEMEDLYKEEFYKLKYCSTVVYMVPRA